MKSLLFAFQFLSRVPIKINIDLNKSVIEKAILFFPIVGLFLGIINYITIILFNYLKVDPIIISFILLAQNQIYTGAMHLDGLSDYFDGIFSNRPKERIIEIMKDSHIGVFGSVSIFFLLLGKLIALRSIVVYSPTTILFVFMLSRVFLMNSLKKDVISESKLGRFFSENVNRSLVNIFTIIIIILIVLFSIFTYNYNIIISIVVGYLTRKFLEYKAIKVLGALNGDVYGTIVEISELMMMITLGATWNLY